MFGRNCVFVGVPLQPGLQPGPLFSFVSWCQIRSADHPGGG